MLTPYKILILPAVFLLAIADVSNAQKEVKITGTLEIPIEQISINQGLSQGMTFAIVEDKEGFLWIATKDGLNRYDGTGFKVYHHDPKDPNSIAENYLTTTYVDTKNRLWVGYNSSGLDLFDRTTDRFIHFGGSASAASGLRTKCVNRMIEDPNGNLMVFYTENSFIDVVTVTQTSMNREDEFQIRSLEEVYPGFRNHPLTASPGYILGFSHDGKLWYVEHQHIYAINPNALAGKSQPFAVNYTNSLMAKNLHPSQFFFDYARDNLYHVTDKNLILKYDSANQAFMAFLKFPKVYDFSFNYQNQHITFSADRKNQIWISVPDADGIRVNLSDQRADLIQYNWDYTERVVRGTPLQLNLQDKSNNLWFATSGHGLLKINARMEQFNRVSPKDEIMESLRITSEYSSAVHDDEINKKWMICMDQLSSDFEMRGRIITVDTQQFIWSGAQNLKTGESVLLRVHPDDCSYEIMALEMTKGVDIFAQPILKDHFGEIWLTQQSTGKPFGFFHLNQKTRALEKYFFPVDAIGNEYQFVSDWYIDQSNLFWLGTKQGLFVFDPKSAEWKHHYEYDPNDPESISGNHILSLCPDPTQPDRFLWIGTDGSGMNKLDYTTGKFTRFNTDNHLPNNVIYSIQSDKHQNLWISTNNGLCLFNPVTLETRNFTSKDGLPGNEFNRFQYSKSVDGLIYVGGPSGSIKFNPEVFYEKHSSSAVVINHLKLQNKEVLYKRGDKPESSKTFSLPAPVELCKKLVFKYNQRMITFGFSVLDFTNPDGNRYKYKMEGFNKDWIDAGFIPEATYTNLSPGDYTFQVLGCNSANVWSTEPASMEIVILPPWWGAWWFRILVFMTIGSGIYAFYRFRLQQALKLQLIRNRIAADLHDDIGSTLSSISLVSSVVQKKLNESTPEVKSLLHQITHNTDNMMEAMSDIVWAVNTKNDRFDNVIRRMRAFAVEILEPDNINLHFNINQNVNHLQLDMQQRKNLYLIFKEAINNAAKYAHCKNVWVDIDYKSGKLIMRVKDDGSGFEVGQSGEVVTPFHSGDGQIIRFGGNGLNNMQKRAGELKGILKIDSSVNQGTEVEIGFNV